MSAAALVCGMSMMLGSATLAAADVTGVSGTVSLAPAGPGPQHMGEPDARPYPGAAITLHDAQGSTLARTASDGHGHFTVALPPGTYEARVQVQRNVFARCPPVRLVVAPNQVTSITIVCDSGMR